MDHGEHSILSSFWRWYLPAFYNFESECTPLVLYIREEVIEEEISEHHLRSHLGEQPPRRVGERPCVACVPSPRRPVRGADPGLDKHKIDCQNPNLILLPSL
jgi:hypothetical protein